MRFATLLTFAAATLLISSPVQAKDMHCAAAEADVAAITAKLPIEVDAVTQTVGGTVACATKQISLKRTVDLKLSRMEADFKDFLQKQDNQSVCPNTTRRALLDAGWKWIVTYTFQEGDTVEITAQCK